MVLFGSIRKITKPSKRFFTAGLIIAGAVIFIPRIQASVARSGPVLSGFGSGVADLFESLLPFDILGTELGKLGTGFGTFGQGVGSGVKGIFSPLTDLVNFVANLSRRLGFESGSDDTGSDDIP